MKISFSSHNNLQDKKEYISFLFTAENIPDGISIGRTYSDYMNTIYSPFDDRIIMELDRDMVELLITIRLGEKKENDN